MGGYRISALADGRRMDGDWGLNLPTRNLFHELLFDAGLWPALDGAILGPACDPDDLCRGCPHVDGFVFDGEPFREVMRAAVGWLDRNPGWTDPDRTRWSSGGTSWHVARNVVTELAALPGERIVFHDDLFVEAGWCPEGAPYRRYPRRFGEAPAFARNLFERKRNLLAWCLSDLRYALHRLSVRHRPSVESTDWPI